MEALDTECLMLSRAMMYRRQKRRHSKSNPSTQGDVIAANGTQFQEGPEFWGYLARDLPSNPLTPSPCPSSPDETGLIPESGFFPAARQLPTSPSAFKHSSPQVIAFVATQLECIGDEHDPCVSQAISEAIAIQTHRARERGLRADTVTYPFWKKAIEDLMSVCKTLKNSVSGIAAVFRFTDMFLSQAEDDSRGIPDVLLEQRLEEHNKRILVDLFAALFIRGKGIASILTEKEETDESPSKGACGGQSNADGHSSPGTAV